MTQTALTSKTLLARGRALIVAVLPLLAVASTARATSAADAPPSSKPWLKGVVDRGTELAKKKVEPNTPNEAKWRDEAKALIDDTLDWPELTQQALGSKWKTLNAADQAEFTKLLREMIEASYQSKLKLLARGSVKKPAEVKLEWLDEKQEGNDASVSVRVKADKSVAVLEFKQKFANGRWRVWDVSIDEVSTVRTYRTQFTKIIAKDGFPALIARMNKKTEEIRAGKSDIGPD